MGWISVSNMLVALQKQTRIILTDIQLYFLQSIMQTDEHLLLNYKLECRIIAEMVKRFFAPHFQTKLQTFIEMAPVQPNEYMQGWSDQDIAQELLLFKTDAFFNHPTYHNLSLLVKSIDFANPHLD